MSDQPLAGVRVLDFTQNLPGPYATFILASLGAEVIKVEPPRGDPGRVMGSMFDKVNRGKRAITLDLRDDASADTRDALLAWADVVVEGFRPGVMDRLGAGFEHARAQSPRVIYASISAFGQSGPRVSEPAHDLNLQALTGVSHTERSAKGPHGLILPIADLSTSLCAVASITAALAGKSGPTHLDLTMADATLSWSELWGEGIDLGESVKKAKGKRMKAVRVLMRPLLKRMERDKLFVLPHYGLFECRDGKTLCIGIVDENKFWRSLCNELGLTPFAKLPMPARVVLGPVLRPMVAARIKRKSRSEWLARLEAAGVPATPVLTVQQARSEPQFRHRQSFDPEGRVRAPVAGAEHIPGRAPLLGEHNESIRQQLGLTA
ncbi:MAG: CoA transferase [Proteobacteria bacterium]|nr:CoA transferase [Pseudomonadota bacterium]